MNTDLRVLILTPAALPSVTGNAVTAERWRLGLSALGLGVEVLAAARLDPRRLLGRLVSFDPHVVHVHHASRAGALLLDPLVEPEASGRTLVVSPGGTDIHQDLAAPDRAAVVEEVFRRARAVVAQGQEMARSLEEAFPGLAGRLFRVPKAVAWLGDQPFDLAAAAAPGPRSCLFFHPAGVRPVKGNLEGLLLLEKVHRLRPEVRAVFAGPEIDPEYAAGFRREIERLSGFARWVSLIPPEAMRAAYRGADVVLNASVSEGLSNVLLEASAEGVPLLASRTPGNVWPVLGDPDDPPAGLHYDPADPEGFVRQALALVDDPGLRERLGAAGRERAVRRPGVADEAAALARVYRAAVGGAAARPRPAPGCGPLPIRAGRPSEAVP